jgi:two-component system chemotaxis response regulator CheB
MRAAKKRGTQAGSDPSRAAAAPLVRPKDVASALDAVLRSPASFAESARPPAAKRVVRPARSRIVAIAASTGGPRALAEILRQLPANLDVPILIAQHMPPMFTGYLANGLSIQCGLKVSEAYPGARLRPGQVWIAPGDHHMVLRAEGASLEIAINQNAHENACRPSADPLFRSVAEFYEREALAIVLTGMGQDGLLGAREIRERGGRVVVQDEASSVIWGMPGSIARAGIADAVLSLDAIALEILHRAHAPGGRRAA